MGLLRSVLLLGAGAAAGYPLPVELPPSLHSVPR